jgi:hypothetical protein
MSCYRKTHEILSDLAICEGTIADLKYRLDTLLENKQPEVHAKVDFQINGPRSAMILWLTKEEIVGVLKRIISTETESLKTLKNEYLKTKK